jgi:hypothetical protein
VNPIPPIERALPSNSTRRVERITRDDGREQQPGHSREEDRREDDDQEKDGLPHIDVRA